MFTTMEISSRTSKFHMVLLKIFIFLIVFDSARNYTYLPAEIGYIKDAIVFLFGGLLLINYSKIKMPSIGIAFYGLMIFTLFYSWIGIVNSNGLAIRNIVVYILKNIEFFILVIVFKNSKLFNLDLKDLINFYLKLSLVLVFVNIIGYFVPNPIVYRGITKHFDNGYYENRITVGQPAISIFPLLLSYFYTAIFVDRHKILKMIIYTTGIIISVSTTGVLSFVLCNLILLLFINNLNKDARRQILKFYLLMFLFAFVVLILIVDTDVFKQASELIGSKIKAFFFDDGVDPSMKIRDLKFESALKKAQTLFDKLFGLGAYGYYDVEFNSDFENIENTYRSVLLFYGYVGASFFILFLARNIIISFKDAVCSRSKAAIMILVLFIIYAMHAYTLDIFYTSTILSSFGLFFNLPEKQTLIKKEKGLPKTLCVQNA